MRRSGIEADASSNIASVALLKTFGTLPAFDDERPAHSPNPRGDRSDVPGQKAQLAEPQPTARAGYTALAKWYDVELTYSSNAIEGNALTRAETAIGSEKGITVNCKPLRDHMESRLQLSLAHHIEVLSQEQKQSSAVGLLS